MSSALGGLLTEHDVAGADKDDVEVANARRLGDPVAARREYMRAAEERRRRDGARPRRVRYLSILTSLDGSIDCLREPVRELLSLRVVGGCAIVVGCGGGERRGRDVGVWVRGAGWGIKAIRAIEAGERGCFVESAGLWPLQLLRFSGLRYQTLAGSCCNIDRASSSSRPMTTSRFTRWTQRLVSADLGPAGSAHGPSHDDDIMLYTGGEEADA